MSADHHDLHEPDADRTTRLLSHLEGVLDVQMLDAMQGAWSMLEQSATGSEAHARAVRSRLLWESITPGAPRAVVAPMVHDLVPSWDDDELDSVDPDGLDGMSADAA